MDQFVCKFSDLNVASRMDGDKEDEEALNSEVNSIIFVKGTVSTTVWRVKVSTEQQILLWSIKQCCRAGAAPRKEKKYSCWRDSVTRFSTTIIHLVNFVKNYVHHWPVVTAKPPNRQSCERHKIIFFEALIIRTCTCPLVLECALLELLQDIRSRHPLCLAFHACDL